MAKNTGTGARKGPIINRTQTFNQKTGQFIKRDEHGKFVGTKDTPFKNVRREPKAKEEEDRTKTLTQTYGK